MRYRNLPLKIAAVCLMFSVGNVQAQDFKSIISEHLNSKNIFLKANLSDFEVINEDFSASMKGNVVKVQQSYKGIPVFNATATALIREKKVNYFTNNFVKNYSVPVAEKNIAQPAAMVFEKVGQHFELKNISRYKLLDFNDADKEGISFAKTKVVYFLTGKGELRLSQQFMFEERESSNYWNVVADASTGEILYKENLTLSCAFPHGSYNHDYTSHVSGIFADDFPNEVNHKAISKGMAPINASYNVFALPVESPIHGNRSMVSNPWFLDASPDGWHTITGGNSLFVGSYNTTRGNNVMAYDDVGKINDAGSYADGGINRVFDFPFSIDNLYSVNQNAAITNLFYMNNKMHDIFYRLGFTESARNFQAFNFGKGGAEGDYVRAEAQDGSGMDNANFATPPDGSRPRMQMFLWNPSLTERFFYNTPTEAVGRKVINYVSTSFGPTLTTTGVTANVAQSLVLDGCTALPAGSLAGKIGLMARGTCSFTVKVKNAQDAGAVAAIIYNLSNSSPTSGMGGTDASITIPSVLVENIEGLYLKGLLEAGNNANVTLKYDASTQIFRDASFDNGIVAHEYGHGISTRLVGSLSSTSNKEQMGEGWSDIFALTLTNRPGDNASVARGIGNFSSSLPAIGSGIRPRQYSPNFAVNEYTYGKTNGMEYTNSSGVLVPDVHSIGFVWATMLWDLHWRYVDKYGYSSDVMANTSNGSTRFLQLVVDALKLTPIDPGFIQGREAILAAEEATTQGKDKCVIWEVFAKRGLGVNASAGSATDINDQVEDFTKPVDDTRCEKILASGEVNADTSLSIYPNPAKNEFFLKSEKNLLGKVIVEIFDASGKLVSSQKIASSEAINTQALVNGVYVVKVSGVGINNSSKLMIKK